MASTKIVGKDSDGNEKTVYVKKPTARETSDAKVYSNRLAARMLSPDSSGQVTVILRSQIIDRLKLMGVWSQEQEDSLKKISTEIFRKERLLACGGKDGVTKTQARDTALNVRKLRLDQSELLSKSRELDGVTLESQTEQASFDYLMSRCVLDEEGNSIFSSVEEYKEASSQPYLYDSALALAKSIFGSDEDAMKKLPENAFLIKYGFADDKCRLIDKSGHLIDEETGKWINADGYFVNDKDEPIDRDGKRLTQTGDIMEDFVEFAE